MKTTIVRSPEIKVSDRPDASAPPRMWQLEPKLTSNPLWKELEGEKIQIPSGRWIFGNILTANAMLDDLERYLIRKNTT